MLPRNLGPLAKNNLEFHFFFLHPPHMEFMSHLHPDFTVFLLLLSFGPLTFFFFFSMPLAAEGTAVEKSPRALREREGWGGVTLSSTSHPPPSQRSLVLTPPSLFFSLFFFVFFPFVAHVLPKRSALYYLLQPTSRRRTLAADWRPGHAGKIKK